MQDEVSWFASSPKELEEFRGKHIALTGREVVASGESAKGVLEKARKKYPSTIPVLTFIPQKGVLVL